MIEFSLAFSFVVSILILSFLIESTLNPNRPFHIRKIGLIIFTFFSTVSVWLFLLNLQDFINSF